MRINIGCGYVSVRADRCSALSLFYERINKGKASSFTSKREKESREYNLNRIKRINK